VGRGFSKPQGEAWPGDPYEGGYQEEVVARREGGKDEKGKD